MSSESLGRDARVGTVVQGRYRILQRLGAGGMGMVYLGEHLMIRRKVAIKTLHAQFAESPEIVSRFHREALAATSIGNQHIVEVLDMGHFDDDGSLYMVLEFLEGRDFGALIDKEGPQPLGRVVRILMQMCEALSAVHAQGIVHRDLKPENVFLIQRGDNPDFVKVLDFGISKFKDAAADASGAKMTATGAALGTPYYMAPEQTQGLSTVDHRVDLYALGAVIYYALTGSHPLEATNLPMLFVKICSEEPTPLCQLRPDVPSEFERIVHRLLSKRPEQRFHSCVELREALAPYANFDGAVSVVRREPLSEQADLFAPTQLGSSASPAATGPAVTAPEANRSLVGSSRTLVGEKRSRAGLYVALGAVAALGVGGVLAMRALGTDRITPEGLVPSVVTSTSEPPAPSAIPSTGAPQVDANVPAVRVSITTEPKNAELYFDGNRIANPFEAELPQTKEPRRLQARLAGFDTLEQDLVLLYPQTVRLTLTKTGSGKATPSQAGSAPSLPGKTAAAPSDGAKSSGTATTPAVEAPAAAPAPVSVAASPAPRVAPAAPANTTAPAAKGRGLKTPF